MEIDFERYHIQSPGAIYMHPDQVHRIIGFDNVTVTAWAITNESLRPEYLQLLEDISPAAPVLLRPEIFELLLEATSLCIKIAVVYPSLLIDQGNALAGLIIAIYTAQTKAADKLSRPEQVTKAFREALAQHFTRLKRPAAYGEKLHLSAAYLNEGVKSFTGQPLSHTTACDPGGETFNLSC